MTFLNSLCDKFAEMSFTKSSRSCSSSIIFGDGSAKETVSLTLSCTWDYQKDSCCKQ